MSSAEEIDVMIRAAELAVIRKAWVAADHPDHAIAREQLRQAVEAHRALLKELEEPKHAGADGSCPDYGSTLDPCPSGCASGTCVVNKPQDTVCPNCAPLLARVSATRVDGSEVTSACRDCGSLDELKWFERTWVDVRTGDTVKLPGTENIAYVRHAVHQEWHVDPRSSEYRPVAMEWSCVHVELTKVEEGNVFNGATLGVLDMDPGKPILIQLTQSEVDAIELLGGWSQRVGMIMTEVPRS